MSTVRIVELVEERPEDLAKAVALFKEFLDTLNFSVDFQHPDEELTNPPANYAQPRGGIWLAFLAEEEDEAAEAVGVVALKPISDVPYVPGEARPEFTLADRQTTTMCEVKRLYTTPRARGRGAGKLLTKAAVDGARARGFKTVVLDTCDYFHPAIAIYEQLGFKQCPPYYENPLSGVLYYSLPLQEDRQ